MQSLKVSIHFLVLVFSIFALNACGGKTTVQEDATKESANKPECNKAYCQKKCATDDPNCVIEECDGSCDKEKPSVSPESASNTKLNDGTLVVGDITTCPVTGDVFTISAESPKTEIDGKTYYFCCAGCVDKFKADPAKFLNAKPKTVSESASSTLLNDGTRIVGDVTKCPVSGNAFTISADSPKAEIDGKTYYFCCAGCVDKFKADPAKFL